MANITAKTSSNVYFQARCKAAGHNEQLRSREGAADIMSIDRGRLYRIEKGVTNPYPEEIHMMADLYNAPELENHFCTEICPLGCEMPKIQLQNLDRISLQALCAFRKIDLASSLLLDITEDGVIEQSEVDDMNQVLLVLSELETVTHNLKVWVKKNL